MIILIALAALVVGLAGGAAAAFSALEQLPRCNDDFIAW